MKLTKSLRFLLATRGQVVLQMLSNSGLFHDFLLSTYKMFENGLERDLQFGMSEGRYVCALQCRRGKTLARVLFRDFSDKKTATFLRLKKLKVRRKCYDGRVKGLGARNPERILKVSRFCPTGNL